MLSLPHLIVLFVIALLIFGPQKLPELARMLGKATADFRKMTSDFRYALEDEVRELDRQTRIREEEVAAATKAVEASPASPEGAVPREDPPVETAIQNDPQDSPYELPPQPSPQGPVCVEEKPFDDNTGV